MDWWAQKSGLPASGAQQDLRGEPEIIYAWLLAVVLMLSIHSAHAGAGAYQFRVPVLPAEKSLHLFARQSRTPLLFSHDEVRGIQTNAVRGTYVISDGLDILLNGTGLAGDINDQGVLIVTLVKPEQDMGDEKIMKDEQKQSSLLSRIALALFGAVGASGLAAQDDADNAAQGAEVIMEEIMVKGVRGGILRGLEQKRQAAGFVDAISAEDLGKFPDLNISEALQRIPGVTLFRNNTGDGQSINLRGLGSQFTRVEINGLTGTNNGTNGRFGGSHSSVGGGFNFEILASELFDNVSVSKSATAAQTEGGLAGLVQLTTPHAFDRDGFNLSVSGQLQHSSTADDTTPRLALVMSQNWDDYFGLSASVAYSEAAFKSDSNGGISARPLAAGANDTLKASASAEQLAALVPQTINYQVDVEDRKTLGLTAGLQFRPSDMLELTVDTIYARIDSDRFFTRADAPPEGGLSGVGNDTIQNGVFQQATITDVQQRIAANDLSGEEDFLQLSAKVDIRPDDNWTITPLVGYSRRENSRTGQLLSFANGNRATGRLTREPVSFTLNSPFIAFSTPGTDYSGNTAVTDPSEFFLNVFLIRPSEDRDEELSTRLDFSRAFAHALLSRVDFGMRYSRRETERKSYEIRIDDVPGADLTKLPTLADALVVNSFHINGAPDSFPDTIISADPRRVLQLYAPDGIDFSQFVAREGKVANVDILGITPPGSRIRDLQARAANRTFDGEEETLAAYFAATFEWRELLLNAGMRYVDTKQTSRGFSVNSSLGTSERIVVENSYHEFLPSITARYNISEQLIARAAYSTSLSRPSLFELRIAENYGGIDTSGGSGSRGNPKLKPFTSQNYDLGLEWYFSEEALVAANIFYKDVDGLVIGGTEVENRSFLSQVTSMEVTAPIIFDIPVNGDETSIKGLELLLQSGFGFLPGTLSNMGAILNYTYTDTDAATDEASILAGETILNGVSGNSYNVILYYDDGERFDARLSYAWRERFLEDNSASFGVPIFQNDYGQWDFSANYAFNDHFTFQFQVLNISDERLEVESVANSPHTTTQLDRRFFFGVRYSF